MEVSTGSSNLPQNRLPSRRTSLSITSETNEDEKGWFTRQVLKLVLMFLVMIANICAAVVLVLIQNSLKQELPVNVTLPNLLYNNISM